MCEYIYEQFIIVLETEEGVIIYTNMNIIEYIQWTRPPAWLQELMKSTYCVEDDDNVIFKKYTQKAFLQLSCYCHIFFMSKKAMCSISHFIVIPPIKYHHKIFLKIHKPETVHTPHCHWLPIMKSQSLSLKNIRTLHPIWRLF